MRRTLLLSILALLLWAGCANDAEPLAPAPAIDTVAKAPEPVRGGVNAIQFPTDGYTQHDPVAFIGYLKANVASGTVILDKAPQNWIQKKHVKPLVTLLDDTTPCAGISLHNAGPNPPDNVHSTVAAEALLLLETYRQKAAYPVEPGSLQFIKILQRSPEGKLVLQPQPQQVEEAKKWAAGL